MRPSNMRPLLFALAFGSGLLACDKAPAPSPEAKTKPTVAKASAPPAKAPPAVQVELTPSAPAAEVKAPAAADGAPAAAEGAPAVAPADGTPAAAPADKAAAAAPADKAPAAAPADKAEGKAASRSGSDAKQRSSTTPKSGRKVKAFTDCQPSETYADGRCFSSQNAACKHLGCEGKCMQMKSMPPQARCG